MYPNGSAALSRFKVCGTAHYLSDIKDTYLRRVGTDNLPKRKRSKNDDSFSQSSGGAYRQAIPMTAEEEIRLHSDAAEVKERIDKLEGALDDVVLMLKHYMVATGQCPELDAYSSPLLEASN